MSGKLRQVPVASRFPGGQQDFLGSPRITDRGEEVIADILMPGVRMRAFYFRTLAACEAAAAGNIAAYPE